MTTTISADNGSVSGSAGLKSSADSSGILQFQTGANTAAVTIDASQNVGLGVTPSAWLTYTSLQVKDSAFSAINNNQLALSQNGVYTTGSAWKYINSNYATLYQQYAGTHVWYNAASGTAGNAITFTQAMTLDASGNLLLGGTSNAASARFISENASGNQLGLRYTSVATYYNSVDSSGNLIWTKDGTERMRLDSSGNLLVGKTAPSNTTKGATIGQDGQLNIVLTTAGGGSQCIFLNRQDTTGDAILFRQANNTVGSISVTGSTTSYNITSDQRLKENIQDADDAASLVDALQVRKFDWKADNNHQRYGFIAQELVTIAPEAVHQPANPDEMMAVDYSKLVPMLVKEIQSLRKRLTALEGKA